MTIRSYPDCLEFLFSRNQFAIKMGLDNMRALVAARNWHQGSAQYYHIAGTNGKGTTAYFLKQLWEAEGSQKVGMYTSPHLVGFRERIQVGETCISRDWILQWLRETQALLVETRATYFECVTLMALEYFSAQGCDTVILETGLGGRLDATNIIEPTACLITSISFDHQAYLGHTLPEIAREKLGIVKSGVPLFMGEQKAEAVLEAKRITSQRGAPLFLMGEGDSAQVEFISSEQVRYSDAQGSVSVFCPHGLRPAEQKNLALSMFAFRESCRRSRPARLAPASVTLRPPPGRLQVLEAPGWPQVILDCSHNEAAFLELRDFIRARFPDKEVILLLSMMSDKDSRAIKTIAGQISRQLYFEPLGEYPRALSFMGWQQAAPWTGSERVLTLESGTLISLLEGLDPQNQILVVAGSFYLLGKAIPHLWDVFSDLRFFKDLTD